MAAGNSYTLAGPPKQSPPSNKTPLASQRARHESSLHPPRVSDLNDARTRSRALTGLDQRRSAIPNTAQNDAGALPRGAPTAWTCGCSLALIGLSGSCGRATLERRGAGRGRCSGSLQFCRRAPPPWCPATPPGRPPAGAGGTYRWTDPVTDRPGYGPGCSRATETVLAVGMGGRTRRPGVLMHAGCDSRGWSGGDRATATRSQRAGRARLDQRSRGSASTRFIAGERRRVARSWGPRTSRSDDAMGCDFVPRMPGAAAPERPHRTRCRRPRRRCRTGIAGSASSTRRFAAVHPSERPPAPTAEGRYAWSSSHTPPNHIGTQGATGVNSGESSASWTANLPGRCPGQSHSSWRPRQDSNLRRTV